MAKKRSRGSNFSYEEKSLLLKLIYKYRAIENKKTDGVSVKEKAKAWACLTNDFNSASLYTYRNEQQLRTLWDNLKRSPRPLNNFGNKEVLRTGGGITPMRESGFVPEKSLTVQRPFNDGFVIPLSSDHQFHGNENMQVHPTVVLPEIKNENESVDLNSCSWSPNLLRNAASLPSVNPSMVESPQGENEEFEQGDSQSAGIVEEPVNSRLLQDDVETIMASKIDKRLERNIWNWSQPLLDRDNEKEVIESKKALIDSLKKNAEEESKINLLILQEKLRQEKLRTEIVELELKEKKRLFNCAS